MNKKGVELTINTMIIIALGLFVLVIMFFVLQKNIIGGSEKYLNFSLETERELRSENTCQKLFSGRVCMPSCTGDYSTVPGDWADCNKLTKKPACCRIIKNT